MDELSFCLAKILRFNWRKGYGFAEIIESSSPIDPSNKTFFFHARDHRVAVGAAFPNVCFSDMVRSLNDSMFEPPLELAPDAQIIAVVAPAHLGLKAIQWGQLADPTAFGKIFAQGWGPQGTPATVKGVLLPPDIQYKHSNTRVFHGELESFGVTDGNFSMSLARFGQPFTELTLGLEALPDRRGVLTCPMHDIRLVPRNQKATTWRILIRPQDARPLTALVCVIITPLEPRSE